VHLVEPRFFLKREQPEDGFATMNGRHVILNLERLRHTTCVPLPDQYGSAQCDRSALLSRR